MRKIKIFTLIQAAAQFPKLIEFVAAVDDVIIVSRRIKQVFRSPSNPPMDTHPVSGNPRKH
jgi:hypothetical protein